MNKLEEISLVQRRAARHGVQQTPVTVYEVSLLLKIAHTAFEVYQGLEHNAFDADEAQTKLGDALEPLILEQGDL